MTNLDIVNDAIESLERQEITFAIASKLADLYIVKDHMNGIQSKPEVREVGVVEVEPKSEFMEAVQQAGAEKAWEIMDDLMATLKVVNSRLYDGVIRKLRE